MHDAITAGRPGPRPVRSLAVLGDSVAAGMGDPIAGRRWRGFAPLLAEAAGAARFTNLATSGARVADLRRHQLPAALRAEPDAAVVMVGMNDTMRSDFDPRSLWWQLNHAVRALVDSGAAVVTIRYHDHARVFPLPGPLRRLLHRRIEALNRVLTEVAEDHGAAIVDLHHLPDAYHPSAWSVDRLHPSELGHRLLARAFAGGLAELGLLVPGEVSLTCSGGVPTTRWDHLRWCGRTGGAPDPVGRLRATWAMLARRVDRLCRDYPVRDAAELLAESRWWLDRTLAMTDKRLSLARRREILVRSGWLAALVSCLTYDEGNAAGAENWREATAQLGREAGHAELVGWSSEIAAWMALTPGRPTDAAELAASGEQISGTSCVSVQLTAQRSRA
ncbi:SGNH/GDSL hydrolase family protein [Saccharopolyspora griseoalba]|uniref:SGNH/GDSL hydrolase family protein n=1 Tax=Saccharopolyspora griseoalba TaxID=1431848 RepID=A0ABW2LNM8_9PSEU